jgi:hypothetical protein
MRRCAELKAREARGREVGHTRWLARLQAHEARRRALREVEGTRDLLADLLLVQRFVYGA